MIGKVRAKLFMGLHCSVKTSNNNILLKGTLRKKGKIFLNEREVIITEKGVLNYFYFDEPGIVKGSVDLTSMQV